MAKAKAKARPAKPQLAARWLREAQGVVALGLAAYLGVALLSYDPALRWVDQGARVGIVGLWLGWALFTTVGYAAYLVPVVLMVWAFAAFTRPIAIGTLLIVVGGTLAAGRHGLLARLSGPRGASGSIGAAGSAGRSAGVLRRTLGDVGGLVLLLTLMAVAGLCITRRPLRRSLADHVRRFAALVRSDRGPAVGGPRRGAAVTAPPAPSRGRAPPDAAGACDRAFLPSWPRRRRSRRSDVRSAPACGVRSGAPAATARGRRRAAPPADSRRW